MNPSAAARQEGSSRCAPPDTDSPNSPYVRLERPGDGFCFAVALAGTGARGHAGIVDLGNETLLFDTLLTAQAGKTAVQAATTSIPEAYSGHGFASGFAENMRVRLAYRRDRMNPTGKVESVL